MAKQRMRLLLALLVLYHIMLDISNRNLNKSVKKVKDTLKYIKLGLSQSPFNGADCPIITQQAMTFPN